MPSRRHIALALIALLALVLAPPWQAPTVGPELELEHAWMFALSEAWGTPMVFGRDIVWTYGPWGFALTPLSHPNTFWLAVSARSFLALVVLAAVDDLARKRFTNAWPTLAITLFTALTFTQPDNSDLLCAYIALLAVAYPLDALRRATEARSPAISPAVAAAVCSDRVEDTLTHAIAFAAALAGMGKFTFFVAGGVAMACVAAAGVAARHRVAFAGVTWLVASIALWLAAGQPVGALPGYLRWCVAIVSAYTEAMALPTPLIVLVPWVLTQIGVVALLAMVLWPHRRRAWAWAMWLGALLVIYIVSKGAIARHAGTTVHLALPVLPILAFAWLRERGRAACVASGAVIAFALAGAHVTGTHDEEHEPRSLPNAMLFRVVDPIAQLRSVADAFSRENNPAARQARSLGGLAASIQQPSVPGLNEGSVDTFRVDNQTPAAMGLNYRPHPVLQSYQACSPPLEALNVEHLLGPDAPTWVFYRFSSIDHRYPTIDEPRVLTTLWSDYVPVFQNSRRQVALRRQPGSIRLTLGEPLKVTAKLGEWVNLSPRLDEHRLWARIEVRHNSLGKIAGLLYRFPVTVIEIRRPDRTTETYRLVLAMARAGFPLSPVSKDTLELFMVPRPDWRNTLDAKRVTAIRVMPADGESALWAYESDVSIELSAMTFEPAAGSGDRGASTTPDASSQR